NQGSRITCLIVGLPGSPFVDRVTRTFEAQGSFWLATMPEAGVWGNGYGPRPPAVPGRDGPWAEIRPVRVETAGVGPLPTDDWPFLYLRRREIPALNLRGMALVAGIALALLLSFAPFRSTRPS